MGGSRRTARHARASTPRRVWPLVLLLAALALVVCLAGGYLVGIGPMSFLHPSTPHEETVTQVRNEDVEPTPEEPAHGSSSEFGQMVETGEVHSIRLIGDSITAGYLTDGFDTATPSSLVVYSGPQGIYTETPASVSCWANDFRSWAVEQGVDDFVNAAVSGFKMKYLADSPDSWLGDGADVIVVMLGTNDAARVPFDDFKAATETGLAAAASRCKHLVVVSPPDNQRTDATTRYDMGQVDQVINQVCQEHGYEHISLLDVLQVGTDDFNPDQLHPTTKGSDKLWEAFKERLDLY